eukprot:7819604-Alexandrium_andersonii.AAC.1
MSTIGVHRPGSAGSNARAAKLCGSVRASCLVLANPSRPGSRPPSGASRAPDVPVGGVRGAEPSRRR